MVISNGCSQEIISEMMRIKYVHWELIKFQSFESKIEKEIVFQSYTIFILKHEKLLNNPTDKVEDFEKSEIYAIHYVA